MRMLKSIFLLLILSAIFSGCVGTSGTIFIRATEDRIDLGSNSYNDIIELMGEPNEESKIIKNNKEMKVSTYAYVSTGGKATSRRGIPGRWQSFFFYDDILVGHHFQSSWEEDNSDFDEEKIKEISTNLSTKEEVIKLIGNPGGRYIYPMAKNIGDEVLVYIYQDWRQFAYSIEVYSKDLYVTCNEKGLVTNVEYTQSGKK